MEQVRMLEVLPRGSALDVLLKVNTGMNRLGVQRDEFAGALAALEANAGVGRITLMTHFADADDERGVQWQLDELERVAGDKTLPRTLANSAAILRYPETHAQWVRPGIMLYGSSPFADRSAADLDLRAAMTLKSEIIATRTLARGDRVGYGGTYTAERSQRIGVVACGYADGYPRHAPTGTPVAVAGRLTRTVGRVSMDMMCVDLTDIADAQTGAPVTLWGEGNPVEDVAAAAGTISYELMCALAQRVLVVERA
jgi:alanine racemase